MSPPMPPPAEPASPCTGVCALNEATKLCDGCNRTMAEIVAWPSLSNAGKAALLAALQQRRGG